MPDWEDIQHWADLAGIGSFLLTGYLLFSSSRSAISSSATGESPSKIFRIQRSRLRLFFAAVFGIIAIGSFLYASRPIPGPRGAQGPPGPPGPQSIEATRLARLIKLNEEQKRIPDLDEYIDSILHQLPLTIQNTELLPNFEVIEMKIKEIERGCYPDEKFPDFHEASSYQLTREVPGDDKITNSDFKTRFRLYYWRYSAERAALSDLERRMIQENDHIRTTIANEPSSPLN
jgi:hypothetical protein